MSTVEPTFDTNAAWWPCQPAPELAVSNVIIENQRFLQDFATKEAIENAWTGAGGDLESKRWATYMYVHTLMELEITLPNGDKEEIYTWNSLLWIERASWFDTPGVNKVYCVQRLYPNSPVGFTKFPPPVVED